MKKIKLTAAVLAAITALSSAALVTAADEVTVTLDGAKIEYDVPAQIISDRTLVPVRMTFEAMGAEIGWDQETQTVTSVKDGKTLSLVIGSNEMIVDGTVVEIDVPAQIVDDRTLIPARAVAQAYGYNVDWDGDTRTVIITSPAATATAAPAETTAATTAPETTDTPTETTAATAAPETTAAPTTAATAAPTATPEAAATDAPEDTDFGIDYDSSAERTINYMKGFTITDVKKTSDGKYSISYKLETFFEGNGRVTVSFNCLDESGKIVDSWSRSYKGSDYAWSPQTDTVEVSADTKTVELVTE